MPSAWVTRNSQTQCWCCRGLLVTKTGFHIAFCVQASLQPFLTRSRFAMYNATAKCASDPRHPQYLDPFTPVNISIVMSPDAAGVRLGTCPDHHDMDNSDWMQITMHPVCYVRGCSYARLVVKSRLEMHGERGQRSDFRALATFLTKDIRCASAE